MSDARSERDRALAHGLLRATLGLNLLLHGLTRILAGTGRFAAGLARDFAATPLPPPLVRGFGAALPWLEAAVGLLILLGLLLRAALSFGMLLMLPLAVGTALQAKWDVLGLQLVYSAVYAALLFTCVHDRWSLDALARRRLL